MDIRTNLAQRGAFTLVSCTLIPEQQNKIYHISKYVKDYLLLPLPYCEVRELPNWDRKCHVISDPDAQKLIESFHRYGPKVKIHESQCPFMEGTIKGKFASLVGHQNLATTFEGESERYRNALLKFLNPIRVGQFSSTWEKIANQWVSNQIQQGETDLFDSVHRLVAQCLLEGILSYKHCSKEDVNFNVNYWKQLFKPLPHELKPLQQLEQEGKPNFFQKKLNFYNDRFELSKSLWTYFVESVDLKSLAVKIYQGTLEDENSLCHFLNQNGFNETEILNFLKGMLLAGQETTGYLLGFAIYEYAKNPQMQVMPSEDSVEIRNVFLETLRLYSPGGALREAGTDMVLYYKSDSKVEGSEIPREHFIRKGDTIACVPYLAGYKQSQWVNPHEFNSDRDNLEKVNDTPHFGSGPHRCIGEKVARNEIMTLLKIILSRATFEINEPLPDLIDSFSLRPTHDIKIKFKAV